MARKKRIKVSGRQLAYHTVSRVTHRDYRLNEHMKKFFVSTLIHMNRMYFSEIGAFCCMSNHTHLLIRFPKPEEVDPDSAIFRWNRFHRKKYRKNRSVQEDRDYVVHCLTDISHFMKKLNTLMTREHNRITGHAGTLWESRFKSSIVERGKAMLMTGAYIDLNSFRASIVAKPEAYEYSSLFWLKKGNPGKLVETSIFEETLHVSRKTGIKVNEIKSPRKKKIVEKTYLKALYKSYITYIYKRGSKAPKRKLIKGKTDSIKISEAMQEQLNNRIGEEDGEKPELSKGVGLCKKIANFTGGKFIGTSEGAKDFYASHVDPGYKKKRAARHKVKWVHGMAGGIWSIYNGSGKNLERKKEQGQGHTHPVKHDQRRCDETNGIGGQRGSPPTW